MTEFGHSQRLASASLCQIIKENEFIDNLKEIVKDFERVLELEEAIDWALSRNPTPEEIEKIEEDYYLWVTEDFEKFGIPSVRVVYHFNSEGRIVTLISIGKGDPE